jgi:hypothetical protein
MYKKLRFADFIHCSLQKSPLNQKSCTFSKTRFSEKDGPSPMKRGNATDRTIRTEPTSASWILLTIRTYMAGNSLSPW